MPELLEGKVFGQSTWSSHKNIGAREWTLKSNKGWKLIPPQMAPSAPIERDPCCNDSTMPPKRIRFLSICVGRWNAVALGGEFAITLFTTTFWAAEQILPSIASYLSRTLVIKSALSVGGLSRSQAGWPSAGALQRSASFPSISSRPTFSLLSVLSDCGSLPSSKVWLSAA